MTDRERLLEQADRLDDKAAHAAEVCAIRVRDQNATWNTGELAQEAASYAMTARALREVVELADDVDSDCKCGWKWGR